MQHADDVLGLVLPQRHARVLAFHDFVDHLLGRVVDVDGLHLGAVDHDVEHLQVAQVEHAAQHRRVALGERAANRLQLDGAPDLLVRRQDVGGIVARGRRQLQQQAHDVLDGGGERI